MDFVRYSDFGAMGDGKTNDFYAIKKAHEFANEKGLKVKADASATYYISNTGAESITIMTDVDFSGASFIIDDRDIPFDSPERDVPIFFVKRENEPKTFDADSEVVKALNSSCPLDIDTKKLNYAPGYAAMVVPYDANTKVYKRLGANANSGATQHELVIIDKDGNIDEKTPILLPYHNVTKLVEFRIDDTPITIENATFTTRANKAPREYTYYDRNFVISRSNVTMRNITHLITDETETGAPYHGFFDAKEMNNLLVDSCVLTGHKCYVETSGRSNMGSYDISASSSNGLYFKNCRQTNFFYPDGTPSVNEVIWGIMGTNYCKNMTYDSCLLTRLDAHAGVYNATVKNSEIIYIRLTGGGLFLLEDSTVYGDEIVSLRADFGCTWRGDVVIKNTKLVNKKSPVNLFNARFYEHHNFGYQSYYPQNITVDNLTLATPADVYVYNKITPQGDFDVTAPKVEVGGALVDNVNQMIITKKIDIKNTNSTTLSFHGAMSSVFNAQMEKVMNVESD